MTEQGRINMAFKGGVQILMLLFAVIGFTLSVKDKLRHITKWHYYDLGCLEA